MTSPSLNREGRGESKNLFMNMKKKIFSLLVLLVTAVTSAWAADTYTVAGSNSAMFGSVWDASYTANDMTKNDDGTYSITYTNVYLDDNVQYKVVVNHAWDEAYPADGDRVITIAEAGTYTLTIHFNPNTHEVYETMPGVAPTYDLKVGTNAQGTVKFYVAETEVTKAEEGATVTVAIEPNTGWSVGGLQGLWYAAEGSAKAPRRVQAGLDLLKDFELEPVEGTQCLHVRDEARQCRDLGELPQAARTPTSASRTSQP